MELTELFQAELDREVARSRRALEQVPEGKADWKPHEKSMIFGYLTEMVATIPTWITMIIKQDELDIAPKEPRRRDRSEEHQRRVPQGARRGRRRRTRRIEEHQRRVPEDDVASARGREGGLGAAAPRDDSRHDQSLGAPSRPDDRLFAPDGGQGPCAIRAIGRRQALLRLGSRPSKRPALVVPVAVSGFSRTTPVRLKAEATGRFDRRATPAARDRSRANTSLTPADNGRAQPRRSLAGSQRPPAQSERVAPARHGGLEILPRQQPADARQSLQQVARGCRIEQVSPEHVFELADGRCDCRHCRTGGRTVSRRARLWPVARAGAHLRLVGSMPGACSLRGWSRDWAAISPSDSTAFSTWTVVLAVAVAPPLSVAV